MRRSILLLPGCLALAALAGCGNKGPLYLPPPTPAPTVHPAPAPAHVSTASAPASSSSVVTKPLGDN
jgi:predicted small lipoprotein YifL